MNEYSKIFRAFTDYCYKHVDELKWKSYISKDESYRYYRTDIDGLQVIVGLNLERDEYFLALKNLGDIGNKSHRMIFPSKLQRLFFTLHKLERKGNYERQTVESDKRA